MADRPPADADVSLGTRLGQATYQVIAILAMLAHVLIVGLLCLVTLTLTIPPGAEVVGLAFKASVVIVWLGMGYVGFRAWRGKRWWVIVVPFASIFLAYKLIVTGNEVVGWYLNFGY